MKDRNSKKRMSFRGCCLFALLLIAPNFAQGQSPCRATLEESELLYDRDLFQAAIDSLEKCLPDGFSEENLKVRAYKLKALSHVALNHEKDARKAVDALLAIRPKFNPDRENDPELFIALVDKAKRDIRTRAVRQKKKKRRIWALATTGVLASGGVAAYLILKPDPILPGPPSDPPGFPR